LRRDFRGLAAVTPIGVPDAPSGVAAIATGQAR